MKVQVISYEIWGDLGSDVVVDAEFLVVDSNPPTTFWLRKLSFIPDANAVYEFEPNDRLIPARRVG